ncbi:MAG: hypothetical protein Q9173_002555, partial [Seirophora scorigena]
MTLLKGPPRQSFVLNLGVGPTLQVAYGKPTVRRSQTGVFQKAGSRIYTRSCTLTNTKNNAVVDASVLDQAPVSEDEKLKIEVLIPRGLHREADQAVKAGVGQVNEGTGKKGSTYAEQGEGEGKVKWVKATAKMKKEGEAEWDVKLNPGQGVKLELEFEARFPGGEGICDRTCIIALAVNFPVVFIALILGIVYLAWGKEYLDKRRRARAEKEAAERKLGGEEESVASGDFQRIGLAIPTAAAFDTHDDPSTASLRSQASSIITTTTKFSLETLSQDDRSSIVAIRERSRPNPASRPRSTLSMTSIARPAPPYTETPDFPLVLPGHQGGDFQHPLNPPSDLPPIQPPSDNTASVHSPHPPSSSDSATASPPASDDSDASSPLDPDNPRTCTRYYSQIVRTLDQNYTTSLAALRAQHARDLAATRHSIDAAYRTQWKAAARDTELAKQDAAREVEAVKQEAARAAEAMRRECEGNARHIERAIVEHAEQKEWEMQAAVQRARHE